MSAEEQARFTIQALLGRGLGTTTVSRATGLARASEVWGGDVPRERPAWYLWLAGSPGAYQLALEEAEAIEGRSEVGAAEADSERSWHARFSVRYYPSRHEPAFERFSAEERSTAIGGLLDSTGTPRIETASSIPETHFVVGNLEWASSPARGLTAISLSALDRSVVRSRTGPPSRDVPGWRLASPLLTTLAGVQAQIERQAVARIVLSRQRGFELVPTGGGFAFADAEDAVVGAASLLLGRPRSEDGALLEAVRDADGEVIADERFDGHCRHPQSLMADARIPLRVHHSWFGGAAHAEDRIACAC